MKFHSVFDALADTPAQSANLKLRAELLAHIQDTLADMDGTQAELACVCGLTQPRLNDLLQGKISKFSLDALVNINANLGMEVGLVFA
ncbi:MULTISPECIES: helix-turn-helix domain-containing protein [Moraxella]|uniref:Transcriptional regulator n=1 Tax=Moraxella lacunata TaxID=477 RepID=A0A1B8PV66_MORLA|nr:MULTISPECIES: XRE family transcriptional regulator [Moraxella]MBE9579836.1 XRE family transcriptional regulator [Moraxella sp. K1664]MBE9589209.1 XRE family transcriptional regulator [Moraxella sp. K1630]MBE9591561.1 XRE family transcriptional regulator [Moraxella sp. K127]MBE9597470.1 XRE family transcriptional regulator [Moraxella sp. K2450]MDH9219963.1 XRE family transcriptional regulator [Moraxella lacunata]